MDTIPTYTVRTVMRRIPGLPEPPYNTAEKLARAFHAIFRAEKLDTDREHLIVLAMDDGLSPTGYKVVASGGQNRCTVDPAYILRAILTLGGTKWAAAHNHPGSDIEPSEYDQVVTQALDKAAYLVHTSFIDHLIIASPGPKRSPIRAYSTMTKRAFTA